MKDVIANSCVPLGATGVFHKEFNTIEEALDGIKKFPLVGQNRVDEIAIRKGPSLDGNRFDVIRVTIYVRPEQKTIDGWVGSVN